MAFALLIPEKLLGLELLTLCIGRHYVSLGLPQLLVFKENRIIGRQRRFDEVRGIVIRLDFDPFAELHVGFPRQFVALQQRRFKTVRQVAVLRIDQPQVLALLGHHVLHVLLFGALFSFAAKKQDSTR